MEKKSRREFVKSLSFVGFAMPVLQLDKLFGKPDDSFSYQSGFMNISMSGSCPQINSLWIDSLGKNKSSINPVLQNKNVCNAYHSKKTKSSITYWLKNQSVAQLPAWKFAFEEKKDRKSVV